MPPAQRGSSENDAATDTDEDILATQPPPPANERAAHVRYSDSNGDVENRHGLLEDDGARGARVPKIPQFVLNTALDALKYSWAINGVSEQMPWRKIARFIQELSIGPTCDDGKLKDRVRTVANAVYARRGLCGRYDDLSTLEKYQFFGTPCQYPPRPPELAPEIDFHDILRQHFANRRPASKRQRTDPLVGGTQDRQCDVLDEVPTYDPLPLWSPPDEPEPTQSPPPSQPPSQPEPPARSAPPRSAPARDDIADDDDFMIELGSSFDDLVDKERLQLRRGDVSGAFTTRLERCGLHIARNARKLSAEVQERVARCIAFLQSHQEPAFPHTAVHLQSADVAAIGKLTRWLVPWLQNSPQDVGVALSLFERTIAAFAALRALPSNKPLVITPRLKVKDARKRLESYIARGQVDCLVQVTQRIFAFLNSESSTHRPTSTADEREVKRARAAAATMHHPGGISAAMKLLESAGSAPGNADTLQKLRDLCPRADDVPAEVNDAINDFFASGEAGSTVCIAPDTVAKAIRQAKRGKVHDLEGLRFEHLQSFVRFGPVENVKNQSLGLITFLLETLARNPRAAFQTLSRARIVGVPKPKDPEALRPIGITSVFRRLWAKTIVLNF